jgi:hypothetical protein
MDAEEMLTTIQRIQTELFGILPDFKLLDNRVGLSDPNYKYFSVIVKDIRELIQKDIHKAIEPLCHDIRTIKQEAERNEELYTHKLKEIDEGLQGLRAKVENLSIDTNSSIRSIDLINDTIDNMKEDILFRTTYNEFKQLSETVETKTSKLELEETVKSIRSEIFTCAKLSQLNNLQDYVGQINSDIQKLSSIELLNQSINTLQDWTSSEIHKCLFLEDFADYKKDNLHGLNLIHEKIERQENIQGFTNDAFRKELAQLDKAVKKRPWKKDIEIFKMNLQEAAKIIEFQRHQEDVVENLDEFRSIIRAFGQRCDKFEKILERFDEILLEKAAKDDISLIKKNLLLLAKNEELLEFKTYINKEFTEIGKEFENTLDKFNKFESLVNQVSNSFKNFKSDNRDNIMIKNTLLELKSSVETKVEKGDFVYISENIVRKDDFELIKSNVSVLRRQLEMEVIISQSTLKTMIKSSDSAATKNKQRLEILKNSNILAAWVLGKSESEGLAKDYFASSTFLNKSYQDINSLSMLPAIKHTRKLSGSDIQYLDVPKLRGKYEI